MAIAIRMFIVFLVLVIGPTRGHALYGDVDVDNQFPFVVRVAVKKGNQIRFCTASMRTRRMAITAAHCVYDEKTGKTLNNISLHFTDERGAVRRVAAKAFIAPDYAEATSKVRMMKAQFDEAKAKKDDAKVMELFLPLTEATVAQTSRDFALLLPASDVNVSAFLLATIMDDDLPFASTLRAFENSLHRWTPETYARVGAAFKESFVARMPVAPKQDSEVRKSVTFLAHAVGYGLTCRSDKDAKCKLLDGKRRHAPILLEDGWYYPGSAYSDASLMLTLSKQSLKRQEMVLPGDSGGPILIRDQITGRFMQIGVITSYSHSKFGAFRTWAACLLQHAGTWREFLNSAEYRNAMLASSKPRKGRQSAETLSNDLTQQRRP
jgi:V8-like Glu-specific endopeptidase